MMCFYIIEKHSEYTVFYQNFGFPYIPIIRVVCCRTCSNTLVPIHNYPKWVILVQRILFPELSTCVFGDEVSKVKVGVVLPSSFTYIKVLVKETTFTGVNKPV